MLSVVRKPAPDIATLFAGGYIASGPTNKNRQPTPTWPEGLKPIGTEGAGEVQSPVKGDAARELRIGDRVVMRYAKAGEMCERFDEIALVSADGTTQARPDVSRRGQELRMTTRTPGPTGAAASRPIPYASSIPRRLLTSSGSSARRPRLALKVKAVGASHSFTPIAATDGVLLRLDRMNRIVAHDSATGRVRVQAGISLHDLNPQLKALGLALPNLGDVDPQSVAGAVSTGTHGTGGKLFGISAAVVGVQLVTADGEVLEIDESHAWFGAARVTLGALGIVTEVTLQCVPAFLLHAREEPMALPDVLDQVDALVDDNDHFEFYWFPHTDKALTKRNNRVARGHRAPAGRPVPALARRRVPQQHGVRGAQPRRRPPALVDPPPQLRRRVGAQRPGVR